MLHFLFFLVFNKSLGDRTTPSKVSVEDLRRLNLRCDSSSNGKCSSLLIVFNMNSSERARGDLFIRGFGGESYRQCLKGFTISEEVLKRKMSVCGIYTCVSCQLRRQCSHCLFFFLSSFLLKLISFSSFLRHVLRGAQSLLPPHF